MKYIRTKDKILIAPELYDNGGMVLCSDPPKYETRNAKNEWGCVDVSEVIKQADTIEELCDEIIGILNKNIECERYETSLRIGDKLWFDDLEDAEYNKKYCSEIYGAIWTSKGLIYVAKMNEKGELELI